ncbi:hypothetical protein BpHYR1_012142 [Brachionus plicatilis]|uniref:Uncharacterized protein n=1 Tax=Brachionus plicatilis TaxID=10195 RepID=A0A3M7R966_BRAPC|nr:hypothetical protein BpHYR1_012142 [Brachionus plicatilis]
MARIFLYENKNHLTLIYSLSHLQNKVLTFRKKVIQFLLHFFLFYLSFCSEFHKTNYSLISSYPELGDSTVNIFFNVALKPNNLVLVHYKIVFSGLLKLKINDLQFSRSKQKKRERKFYVETNLIKKEQKKLFKFNEQLYVNEIKSKEHDSEGSDKQSTNPST